MSVTKSLKPTVDAGARHSLSVAGAALETVHTGFQQQIERFLSDEKRIRHLAESQLREKLPAECKYGGRTPAKDSESYADGTPLTELLGDHPEVKIFAALLSERNHLVTPAEIAKIAGLTEPEVDHHLTTLCDYDLVETEQESEDVARYQVNTDHETIKDLYHIEQRTLRQMLRRGA